MRSAFHSSRGFHDETSRRKPWLLLGDDLLAETMKSTGGPPFHPGQSLGLIFEKLLQSKSVPFSPDMLNACCLISLESASTQLLLNSDVQSPSSS